MRRFINYAADRAQKAGLFHVAAITRTAGDIIAEQDAEIARLRHLLSGLSSISEGCGTWDAKEWTAWDAARGWENANHG